MLCSKCKKRMAVVFVSRNEGGNKIDEGYCLSCAKELGLAPVDDILKKMGVSSEEFEAMEQMSEELIELQNSDDFEAGGAQTFPFLQNLFGGEMADRSNGAEADKDGKQSGKKKSGKDEDKSKKYLSAYCVNLNNKVKEGKTDRIIGREKEIERVIQILSRRIKNNPCLIGEPGVGKTAIAEGIAQKIVEGGVPYRISGKEVYLLDLTALVAGTQFRGQFESRVKGLIEEIKKEGNVILFIDEIHTIVGTGDSEGSMSAANILKPALSRGEIQLIGATTFAEYRKNIEKDSALERRFQPVSVKEPTIEDSIEVLRGIKGYYESFHKVRVPDEVVKSAVVMSERYITDRFLPDKAIDLLDEACAGAVLKCKEIGEYEKLSDNIARMKEKLSELEEQTENIDYEKIAVLKVDILNSEKRKDEIEKIAKSVVVTEEDLAKVIELWTGILASKIRETEFQKIASLKETLSKRVVGQDEAIDLVCKAIKLSRIKLSKNRRPASFIFVGPTGVGKTELVKAVSETLFDDTEPLIRLDMSEYMEKHAVSKIIGSPPGYVGFDDAGQLTEKVRRRPYSVVLFDEIEKAHPDVLNILLQILDEGKITDSHGRQVSFENTVVVMTSNAGSTSKETGVGFNKTTSDISKDRAMKALREFLRPEFLGRVDEVVVFNQLKKEDFVSIAELMLSELKEALADKGISAKFDSAVSEKIAELSFSQVSGARNIRRIIRKEIEDKIAELIIEKSDESIAIMSICVKDGEIAVECA